MISSGNKKIFFFVILFLIFLLKYAQSLENKIVTKVNNEIITSLDIKKEIQYLSILNPNIKDLSKNEIYNIGKNSLIREKIKRNEILKYISDLKLEEKYLNQLIKSRYSKLNINSRVEFLNHLKSYNVNIDIIEKKITIEALWNQLIYSKFSKKVKIDKNKIQQEVKKNNDQKLKSYLLSEIVFNLSSGEKVEGKYSKIKNSILNNGFENTALKYSISNTSGIGGSLGWINENSLNKSIKNKLSKLKVGEKTEPIFTPSGYLILKIKNIKLIKKKYDINTQTQNLINFKTNQQLNQYSNNYFNKIMKNFEINEL